MSDRKKWLKDCNTDIPRTTIQSRVKSNLNASVVEDLEETSHEQVLEQNQPGPSGSSVGYPDERLEDTHNRSKCNAEIDSESDDESSAGSNTEIHDASDAQSNDESNAGSNAEIHDASDAQSNDESNAGSNAESPRPALELPSAEEEHEDIPDVVDTLISMGLTSDNEDFMHDGKEDDILNVSAEVEETSTETTCQQAERLIMAYVLRHGVSGQGLIDLLELFWVLAPELQISKTKFTFMKQFNENAVSQLHLICNKCGVYLGTETFDVCPGCRIHLASKENLQKEGSFFLTVPIESQIQNIIKECGLDVKDAGICGHDPEVLEDSCCGKMTRKLKCGSNNLTITLTWNTDGVPVFKSSKMSIWPIFCSVNEIPFQKRCSNMILCGLWSGKLKPDMNVFLKPFVDELHHLGTEGIVYMEENNVAVRVFVFSGAVSVDTPARAMIQNIKQFNGKYGCGFCEMEGEQVERGLGTTRVYCEQEDVVPIKRSHERFLEQGERATAQHPVVGVKGASIVSLAPKFDMGQSFAVDYMHAVLLGVTRQFVTLWFEESDSRYSLKRKRSAIDVKIASIRPPKEVRRLPRATTLMKFWKASEWRSFLLFYSPEILKGEFPNVKYYNHWMLLVNGVTMLLQKRIAKTNVAKAHLCLMKFNVLVSTLYGTQHVSYNVHLLTHIAETVLNWGPLWCSSAFSFEDANGRIKDLFHGTRAVPQQMVKNFLLLNQVAQSSSVMDNSTQQCKDLFVKLTRSSAGITCRNEVLGVVPIGKSHKGLSHIHNLVLSEYTENLKGDFRAACYHRFILRGTLFASLDYCERFGRNDSCIAIYEEGVIMYGNITELAIVGNVAYVFYIKLIMDDKHQALDQYVGIDLMKKFKHVVDKSAKPSVCVVSSVRHKCIRVGNMVCILPRFELD